MRIWIDMANSPHVLFFQPLIEDFRERGHQVVLTARDFSHTLELLQLYHLKFTCIGDHEKGGLFSKFINIYRRSTALKKWAKKKRFDLAISHNSYAHILAGRRLGIPTVTMMDYEFQPANHLAFRLARKIIVPQSFLPEALKKYGAAERKVCKYSGLKEEVYLNNFSPETGFREKLSNLFPDKDTARKLLFVVRPAATMSSYHRFENPLFKSLLDYLLKQEQVCTILIPRTPEQREEFASFCNDRMIIPQAPLEGKNLIWHADAVISAGGTMCREAAAFGTPAFTIFKGTMGGIDQNLISENKMIQLSREEDFTLLPKAKVKERKQIPDRVRKEILGFCLTSQ